MPLKAGANVGVGAGNSKPLRVAMTTDLGARNTRRYIYSGSHFRPNTEGTARSQ